MRILDRAEEIFIALSILTATVLVFANVVLRSLGSGLYWSDELIRYLFIWLTFVGISVCIRHDDHISIEFIPELLRGQAKMMLRLVLNVLAIVFSCLFIWYSFQFVQFAYGRSQVTSALNIPFYMVYMIMPISGVLILLRYVQFLFKMLSTKSAPVE